MEFSSEEDDSDVIGVLKQNDTKIVFVSAPDSVLGDKPFTVLYWREYELTIAVSSEFLTEQISRAVELKIQSMTGESIQDFNFEAYANEYMSRKLMRIMAKAVKDVEDPDVYNVDVVLERLLDGS